MKDDFNSRDLFAGLAMCGMLSHYGASAREKNIEQVDIDGATRAYKIADAMIKAREIKND